MTQDEYERIIASPEFKRFEKKVDEVIWFLLVPVACALLIAFGFFAGRCNARDQLCARRCQQDGALTGEQSDRGDDNEFGRADLACNCTWPEVKP